MNHCSKWSHATKYSIQLY